MEVEKTAQTDQTEKEKKSWEDRCKQNRLVNRSRLAGFAKQIEKEEKTAKKKVYDLATKRPFLDSMRGGGGAGLHQTKLEWMTSNWITISPRLWGRAEDGKSASTTPYWYEIVFTKASS